MSRRPRFPVQENGDFTVAVTDFCDEGTQFSKGFLRFQRQFLVVDRQDECAGPRLLLRERGQIAVTGDAENIQPLVLDGGSQGSNAKTAGVLRTEVLVDDDDREIETHGCGSVRKEE